MHWAWGILMLPGFLVVVALVVGIVFLVVRAATTPPPPHYFPPPGQPPAPPAPQGPRDGPLDILARRFASGEITAEEYQKARDLLSS